MTKSAEDFIKYHDDVSGLSVIAPEEATFTSEQVQLQFDLSNQLQRLLVENNKMYILTSTHVYRINLESPSEVTSVQLPHHTDSSRLTNAWLHPSGNFLIIQINSSHHFHLHMTYKKFKNLPRLKGLRVNHVAFSESNKENCTGDFLLSTNEGHIYAASITCHDPETQESKRDDKHAKQVFSTRKEILGLTFTNNGTRVVVALEGELLMWDCFEPTLAELSRALHHSSLSEKLPSPGFFFTANNFYYYFVSSETGLIVSNDSEVKHTADHLSSLVENGISDENQVFVTSKFHFLFLDKNADNLLISSKLSPQNSRFLHSSLIANNEKIIGLASDTSGQTHWVFTNNKIYELIITNEDASAWYYYYKLGEYDSALRLIDCSKSSRLKSLRRNAILIKQGYDFLQRGGFGLPGLHDESRQEAERLELQHVGIKKLAASNEPFEKVCLMLMSVDRLEDQIVSSNNLMITYIQAKLQLADEMERNKVKELVLSSWIVRLFLSQIRNLSALESKARNDDHRKDDSSKNYSRLKNDLLSFLEANLKILDRKTIYQMMYERGFTDVLLEFASSLSDSEFIVQFYIQSESWADALKALTRAFVSQHEIFEHLVYKTSTILLINSPIATTECWLKFSGIDYEKLIPAILAYKSFEAKGSSGVNATLNFLSKLIFEREIKSKAISECYLSLLITGPSSEDVAQSLKKIILTLEFLRQNGAIEGRKFPYYDPNFILRTCLRFKRIEPAIDILVKDLRLHKEALTTALKHNLIPQAEMILRNYEDMIYKPPVNEDGLPESFDKETVDPSTSKLEDEQNSARRQLWVSYAKFTIRETCRNQEFDFYNMERSFSQATGSLAIGKKKASGPSNESESGVVENPNQRDSSLSSRLSQVFRYLLQFSFSAKDNASVLTIKDLLPLLPESIMISNFRAEIVDSLSVFNSKINQLGLEMHESSLTAEKLKIQIDESITLEKRGHVYTIVEPGESCNLCRKLLVKKKFIVFPNCHHGFHKDCMIRYLLQSKGDYTFKRSFRNFKQFSSVSDKKELDEILLKECLLCNESKLNTIDDSLVETERSDALEWVM